MSLEIFLESPKSLTKSENLRIVVPPLANRASSTNLVEAEGLVVKTTDQLIICLYVFFDIAFVKQCNTTSSNLSPVCKISSLIKFCSCLYE